MSPLIHLTRNASERIQAIMAEEKKSVLSITVKGGGCSGLLYEMRLQWKQHFPDVVVGVSTPDGTQIHAVTDKKSALFLDGLKLDFEDGLNGQGFKWHNPNAKGTCGCGQSFKV